MAYGRDPEGKQNVSRPRSKSSGGGVFSTIGNAVTSAAKNSNAAYLQQLQDLLYGSQTPPMGGGGGGSRGGGGGGGGGASAYEKWQIAQEEKRQRELDRRKLEFTQGLQNARKQAMPLLNNYYNQYNKDIGGVFAQNRGLNAGYNQQLQSIANQINGGGAATQRMLSTDLMGQGAGGPELQALRAAGLQDTQGTNFLNLLGQQYNARLAQAMASAQADAQGMGAAIKANSLGQLENSYANALAQIGMIGLT